MIKALVLKLKSFIFNSTYGLHHTTLNNYSETLFEVPENSGLIKNIGIIYFTLTILLFYCK